MKLVVNVYAVRGEGMQLVVSARLLMECTPVARVDAHAGAASCACADNHRIAAAGVPPMMIALAARDERICHS